jgi:phosphoglycerol transferase MdoB-like AlkP superfamily enzyme
MVNYSPAVSIINSDVIPHMKYVPVISNYFKDRIALHPEDANNYNRRTIYQKYGYQHFYALSGTDDKDTLKNQEMLDGRTTDAQTYKDVLQLIQPKKNQFFSVLTMQNHMPFNGYSGSSQLTVKSNYADNTQLTNYTKQLVDTDNATQQFLDGLKKIDKKITVVFYGDHVPGRIYQDEMFKDNLLSKYTTDYFIWTNTGDDVVTHDAVNAAELTPKLLQTTNSKVTPYYALLTKVMEELPAEYNSGAAGDVQSSFNENQKNLLNDLKLVQYDLTSGKNYLKEDNPFFKYPK